MPGRTGAIHLAAMSYFRDFQNDMQSKFGQIGDGSRHRDSGSIRLGGGALRKRGRQILCHARLDIFFHFLERIASEPTSRAKLPITIGATEAMKGLALHPFQSARHDCIVNQEACKSEQCHICCMLRPFVRPRPARLFHPQRCSVISSLSSNHSCSAGTSRKVLDFKLPGTGIQ